MRIPVHEHKLRQRVHMSSPFVDQACVFLDMVSSGFRSKRLGCSAFTSLTLVAQTSVSGRWSQLPPDRPRWLLRPQTLDIGCSLFRSWTLVAGLLSLRSCTLVAQPQILLSLRSCLAARLGPWTLVALTSRARARLSFIAVARSHEKSRKVTQSHANSLYVRGWSDVGATSSHEKSQKVTESHEQSRDFMQCTRWVRRYSHRKSRKITRNI